VEAVNDVTMLFAAEELQKYLEAMTGQEISLTEEKSKAKILLGIEKDIKWDGYRIRTRNNRIYINGSIPRGCLNGSYALLKELGCNWPLPGKDFEVVPRIQTLDHLDFDIHSAPAFRRRGMLLATEQDEKLLAEYVDFMGKNNFNFFFPYIFQDITEILKDTLILEMGKRDMGLEFGGHGLPQLLPRELFDEHPEYFRMSDGQRTNDLNMCASNPEAFDIMARNAQHKLEIMKSFSRPELINFWGDDIIEGGACSCDECKDLGPGEQLLKITNALGERLNEEEIKLAYLGYHETIHAPEKIKPSGQVQLMFAPRERCYHHALDDEECETNKRNLQYLKDNIKVFGEEIEIFEYYQDLILFRYMAVPLHPVIARDVEVYKELGIDELFAHGFSRYSNWAYGSNAYVLGKTLWRGEGSEDDILQYCKAVYGPAASTMKNYFNDLFNLTSTAIATCGYPDFIDMRSPYPHEHSSVHATTLAPFTEQSYLEKIESHLQEAKTLVQNDSVLNQRVDDQIRLWMITRKEALTIYQTISANSEIDSLLNGLGTAGDRQEMIVLLEDILKNIADVSKQLNNSPEHLRGIWGSETGVGERVNYYPNRPTDWIKQLKE
jgi:hypothetical protein